MRYKVTVPEDMLTLIPKLAKVKGVNSMEGFQGAAINFFYRHLATAKLEEKTYSFEIALEGTLQEERIFQITFLSSPRGCILVSVYDIEPMETWDVL